MGFRVDRMGDISCFYVGPLRQDRVWIHYEDVFYHSDYYNKCKNKHFIGYKLDESKGKGMCWRCGEKVPPGIELLLRMEALK